MQHSGRWIITGWHEEQRHFQNKEKIVEHILLVDHHWLEKKQREDNRTFWSWLDNMKNGEIFKTMKR